MSDCLLFIRDASWERAQAAGIDTDGTMDSDDAYVRAQVFVQGARKHLSDSLSGYMQQESSRLRMMKMFAQLQDGTLIPPGPFQDFLSPVFRAEHCRPAGNGTLMVRYSLEYIRMLSPERQHEIWEKRANAWAAQEYFLLVVKGQHVDLSSEGNRSVQELIKPLLRPLQWEWELDGSPYTGIIPPLPDDDDHPESDTVEPMESTCTVGGAQQETGECSQEG